MYKDYGERLKQKIIGQHLAPKGFKGCTEQEIEHIRQSQRVDQIPEVYRQVLLAMGKNMGGMIYKGTEHSCAYLPYLKEEAIKLVIDTSPPSLSLPPDAFVFMMHQGYQFSFFRTYDQNDNPPVFMYVEGNAKFEILKESLTDYYESLITGKW